MCLLWANMHQCAHKCMYACEPGQKGRHAAIKGLNWLVFGGTSDGRKSVVLAELPDFPHNAPDYISLSNAKRAFCRNKGRNTGSKRQWAKETSVSQPLPIQSSDACVAHVSFLPKPKQGRQRAFRHRVRFTPLHISKLQIPAHPIGTSAPLPFFM